MVFEPLIEAWLLIAIYMEIDRIISFKLLREAIWYTCYKHRPFHYVYMTITLVEGKGDMLKWVWIVCMQAHLIIFYYRNRIEKYWLYTLFTTSRKTVWIFICQTYFLFFFLPKKDLTPSSTMNYLKPSSLYRFFAVNFHPKVTKNIYSICQNTY